MLTTQELSTTLVYSSVQPHCLAQEYFAGSHRVMGRPLKCLLFLCISYWWTHNGGIPIKIPFFHSRTVTATRQLCSPQGRQLWEKILVMFSYTENDPACRLRSARRLTLLHHNELK